MSEAIKKARKGFGISKDTRGASSLKFKPTPQENNGLCIGQLVAVEIGKAKYGEDQKGDFVDFAGKEVPTINFVFNGLPVGTSKGKPVHVHSYKPRPVNPSEPAIWFYEGMTGTIKHFIDVMANDKFLPAYDELLYLDIDIEEEIEFEALVKAYVEFFEGVKTVFNGGTVTIDGEEVVLPSLIANEKGGMDMLWLKLLLYNGDYAVNNGNVGFTNYPGDGIIEKVVSGQLPSISVDIAKGDSIIPREKKSKSGPAAPAASATGAPGAGTPPVAGSGTPSFL